MGVAVLKHVAWLAFKLQTFNLHRHLVWLIHLSETLLSRLNKSILLPAAVCVCVLRVPSSTPAKKSSQRGYQVLCCPWVVVAVLYHLSEVSYLSYRCSQDVSLVDVTAGRCMGLNTYVCVFCHYCCILHTPVGLSV